MPYTQTRHHQQDVKPSHDFQLSELLCAANRLSKTTQEEASAPMRPVNQVKTCVVSADSLLVEAGTLPYKRSGIW